MNQSEFPRPITTVLLCVLGAAVGAAVMLFHAEVTEESRQFILTPGFYVWLFLLIACTAVMAVSIPVVFRPLAELKAYFRGSKLEILMLSIVMCALYIVPSLPKLPERTLVLAYHSLRMYILLGLGLIVALQAMIGIWLVNAALRAEFQEARADYRQIQRFLRLRDLLQRFLTVLGALISLLVLANGAFRNALIAAGIGDKSDIPTANILVSGAYFTALVALSYVPTYMLLTAVGQRICDAFFPISSITSESLAEWHTGRKSLEAALNVQVGVEQGLQSGIAILGPLLSGIASILLSG